MSKIKELQGILDKRYGIATVKESNSDSEAREIRQLKITLERIENDLQEYKGLPRKSPVLLKESLQQVLDERVAESSPTYSANAQCNQCGWTGNLAIKHGTFIGNARCPKCGCGPAVLIRESNSLQTILQESLITLKKTPRAGVRTGDILPSRRESLQAELDGRAMEAELKESAIAVLADETIHIILREAIYDSGTNELETVLAGASVESAALLSGRKMYLNKPTAAERRERPEGSLKDWVSTITETWAEGTKLMARIAVHDPFLKGRLTDPVAKSGLRIEVEMKKGELENIYWLAS